LLPRARRNPEDFRVRCRSAHDDSYIRIGGLALDLPPVGASASKIPENDAGRIDEYEELLTGNRIWIGRTRTSATSLRGRRRYEHDRADPGAAGLTTTTVGFPLFEYEEFQFDVPTRTIPTASHAT